MNKKKLWKLQIYISKYFSNTKNYFQSGCGFFKNVFITMFSFKKCFKRFSFSYFSFIYQVLYGEKLLWKFCGIENSADGLHPGYQPILTPGNTVTLIFQTDHYNPERHQNVGFSLQYQAIGAPVSAVFSVTPVSTTD